MAGIAPTIHSRTAAVIRDVTQDILTQRQNITSRIPFNLMKSETLVRATQAEPD